MSSHNRREFLADVGRGMLVASVGSATALDLGLGLSPVWAADAGQRVTFGELEPLVSLMQETAPDKLLPQLTAQLQGGTSLQTLVSAGALANVRAFAGQDYTGYHTFMALVPALQMAGELPTERQPLPVLKVLYRNSSRIQEQGANKKDALYPVAAKEIASGDAPIRNAVRAVNWNAAESQFAALARGPVGEAFNHLQYEIEDEVDVHRVVLAWRAWAMLDVAGEDYAHTLLRQSVRYCLDVEQKMRERKYTPSPIRDLLPQLLDEYKLPAKLVGNRQADDIWVGELADTVYSGTREQAAEAVASVLAEGFDPEAVGEAISLAANRLVLHDPGRLEKYSSPQKPPGCVHGDSVGVHASDAANAWRNISRVSNPRNKVASLIVGAFHTAGQTRWSTTDPYPYADQLESIRKRDAKPLLAQAEEAIRANDQARACAVVHRYCESKLPVRPVFDLLLKYAVSEDGALHAEKYYRTVSEEYTTIRPAFRWRQLVSLARVTASEFGFPAPGHEEACELLRLS